jgi:hypothetical protein
MTNSTNRGSGSGDWLMGAVKKNPEGLLLVAAGCALLLRSGSSWFGSAASGSRSNTSPSGYQPRYGEPTARAQGGSDWGVSEGISRTAESAREYASDVSRSVSETASAYASSIGEYADQAKRSIVDGSGRLAEQAQSTMQHTVDRVLRDQPLAVALAGVAAGALVAAAFPATSMERQALGAAGEKLSEVASKTGQQLQDAASAAGEHLMDAAEEHGLTASGLKEMASGVAGAFGTALSGQKQEKSASSSGGGSSSLSGSQSGQAGSSARGSSTGQYGSAGTGGNRGPSGS